MGIEEQAEDKTLALRVPTFRGAPGTCVLNSICSLSATFIICIFIRCCTGHRVSSGRQLTALLRNFIDRYHDLGEELNALFYQQ